MNLNFENNVGKSLLRKVEMYEISNEIKLIEKTNKRLSFTKEQKEFIKKYKEESPTIPLDQLRDKMEKEINIIRHARH